MASSWLILLAAAICQTNGFTSNRHSGDLGEPGKNLVPNDLNRFYLFFQDTIDNSTETSILATEEEDEEDTERSSKRLDADPLSVVWYLGAFGGLIIFFLVVTFSEWCCASKHLYRSGGPAPPPYQGYTRAPETPPPPYHLFAPPPYTEAAPPEKHEPIFVIPVHMSGQSS